MNYFFELLANRIGFSRIGRISLSKERKLHIKTPNIIIPIKSALMKQFNFIQEFETHDLFIISKEIFLKIGFLREKFKDTGFIFHNSGTLEKFTDTLMKNLEIFTEDNILSIIPFNIPTTSSNKDFALKEIKNYLSNADIILKNHPNLNFGLSIRIFDYSELLSLYIPFIKENENVKILNLTDVFDNFSNFRGIINVIIEIKEKLDNNLVLMASGRIIPKFYPLLVYLGIDLIDSSYLLYLSAENFYDTIDHLLPIYKVKYLPCSCIACKGKLKNLFENKHSSEKLNLLCLHNMISATNYMKKIKQYLTYEDYRAFVEKSSFDDTNLISLLKILDRSYFKYIRYETPLVQESKKVKCLGPSSYNRPDFVEFRERTIKNFQPEPWTSLIIILPCSAKKPYSESKSHKLFYKVIRKYPEFPSFQEIILTSPLGAIPRQLENVYPVNSYDISVIGEWDNEEIEIASNMLFKILDKYDETIPIICHLGNDYVEIIKKVASVLKNEFLFSEIHEKITSNKSLQSLENLIKEYKDKFILETTFPKKDYLSKTWIRKFIKILDYQFGAGSGIKVISNGLMPIRIKANNKIDLIDSQTRENVGVFNNITGQISLTITAIKRLTQTPFSTNFNSIVFNGEKISGNTLFRRGVLEYSGDLIPDNYVIIWDKQKNNVIGAGKLFVGSNVLKNSKTGRIANIYEKV